MMCSHLALALVALSLGSGPHETQADTDWCSLNCGNNENTMCQYEPLTETSTCSNIESIMDNTKRKDILHLHNEYRNRMASGEVDGNWPTASNMRQMSWDYDLERLALRWAQQCVAGHDACRRTPKFHWVGQNLVGWWGDQSLNRSFSQWVNEISEATPSILSSFEDEEGVVSHFTQVIWANSYKLGCAGIQYEQLDMQVPAYHLFCNYGPGGNIEDRAVYEEGTACDNCSDGTQCDNDSAYPNLCASQSDDPEPSDIDPPADI